MTEPTPTSDPDESLDESTLDPRMRAALSKLRSENKSLRTRLHDAEEQVGVHAAREAAHHRAVVAAAARAAGLHDGEDLLVRHSPEEFLDEKFHDVVGDKVVEAAKALIAERPHLGRPAAGPPPTDRPVEGLRPGATPNDGRPKPAPTWASAIRGS